MSSLGRPRSAKVKDEAPNENLEVVSYATITEYNIVSLIIFQIIDTKALFQMGQC